MAYQTPGALRTVEHFRQHIDALELDLPFDNTILTQDESPLAQPLPLTCGTAGNRFCIQPMAGRDAAPDGKPTEHTLRRWTRFGESGAKLIWGGESVAVRRDGRDSPRQLQLTDTSLTAIERLREALVAAHAARFGDTADLIVGLQLSHAGRWAQPEAQGSPAPRIAYRHPLLDVRSGVTDDSCILSDEDVADLIEDFVGGAVDAQQMGFAFVDIKHCHGSLLHEFLGAHTRAGAYGGAWENRTRLLREIVEGIQRDAPGLGIGLRISAYDLVPFRRNEADGVGVPEPHEHLLPYQYGFGVNADTPTQTDLSDAHHLLDLLADLDVELVNVSAGAPHYSVHLQRPSAFTTPTEYEPPEDPLFGVVRLLHAARDLKFHHPDAAVVASGLSYLQEFLPHVSQAIVREEWVDFVGIGRAALSYPDLPADTLEQGRLDRARICRTYSACTTAGDEGHISGCYPLDPHFEQVPGTEHLRLHR